MVHPTAVNQIVSNGVVLVSPRDDTWEYSESQHIQMRQIHSEISAMGLPVFYFDATNDGMSISDFVFLLEEAVPSCIVLDFLLRTSDFSFDLLKQIDDLQVLRDTKVIFFGHAISNFYEHLFDMFPRLDVIVLTNSQVIVPKIVDAIIKSFDFDNIPYVSFRYKGLIRITDIRDTNADIGCRQVDRSYLNNSNHARCVELLSSLGCNNRCSFCNTHDIRFLSKERWYGFSARSVVSEIEELVRNYNVHCFQFIDHNFIGDSDEGRQRALEIADAIILLDLDIKFSIFCRVDAVDVYLFEKLKSAGLFCVNVGIESLSTQLLNRYNKNITPEMIFLATQDLMSLEIIINPSFIIFDPICTLLDILDTMNYIEEYELFFSFSPSEIIPVRNTTLYEALIAENSIIHEDSWLKGLIPNLKYNDDRVVMFKKYWCEYTGKLKQKFPGHTSLINRYIDDYYRCGGDSNSSEYKNCMAYKIEEFNTMKRYVLNLLKG